MHVHTFRRIVDSHEEVVHRSGRGQLFTRIGKDNPTLLPGQLAVLSPHCDGLVSVLDVLEDDVTNDTRKEAIGVD